MFKTLISAEELMALMNPEGTDKTLGRGHPGGVPHSEPSTQPQILIVDCRFTLGSPEAGAQAYATSHIPRAIFADLEKDLSGPIIAGQTGRHPLPDPAILSPKFRQWGITAHTQVIAYDDVGGAYAARLWWLLGWLGHTGGQAVLDGGWSAWLAASGEVSREAEAVPSANVTDISGRGVGERSDMAAPTDPQHEIVGGGRPVQLVTSPFAANPAWLCSAEEIEAAIVNGSLRLFDARAVERYAGEIEPIDRVAGHIPTAQSLPFAENLSNGRFRTAAELRARFQAAGADTGQTSVMYCGSGVTACHNVLAATHAGVPLPRLYAGSYSEWITDPKHAVATGRLP